MDRTMQIKEGFIPFNGYRTWYRVVASAAVKKPAKTPLLCLHGGPGAPHDYLEPLAVLSDSGRQVIFYDQLGCGNSDQPHDARLWNMDMFLREIDAVRGGLGLGQAHILGQSWGGMLAMEYALRKPAGLKSLIIASAPASTRQWVAEANRLRAELPDDIRQTLERHEAAGTTDTSEYTEAIMFFYRRHVCRLDPWPDCLTRTMGKIAANPVVYNTMWGASEFYVTGNLRDWDIAGRLGEIRLPTLLTSGRYDEATPAIMETLRRGIPGARHVLFEHSAHESHIEEPGRYLRIAAEFLDQAERISPEYCGPAGPAFLR